MAFSFLKDNLKILLRGIGSSGDPEDINVIGGAASVATKTGTAQTIKNRNQTLATTYAEATNAFTFTESDNVTHVKFAFSATTGEALQDDSTALVIYDGLNEAAETSMFADAGGIATDVEYEMIPMKDITERDFTSWVGRIAILPIGKAARCTLLVQ